MLAPDQQTQPLTTSTGLAALGASFSTSALLAVDTEFNRTSTYRPQLCLVQLAGGMHAALIDMLADADFSVLKELLVEHASLKLFHAGKQDLECLQLNLGWLPNQIFDTQIGAGLLGYPPQAGYATLVQQILGRQLDKAATRTDWARRPLSAEQLRYAREDVVYLLELYDHLQARLHAEGRFDWAQEDSKALLDPSLYIVRPQEAWRRLGGLSRLPLPVQARAHAIAEWRESRAQEIDRPRQWVLSDKALLNIARADPTDAAALAQVTEVPPAVARRQGEALLAALAQAKARLDQGGTGLRQEPRPEPTDADALKALAKLVSSRANELGVAPELLATRKELTGLLRGEQQQRATSGWRRTVIGDALLAAL